MKTSTTTVQGQRSWRIATPRVEAFVTQTGGHLAPVTFDRRGKKIQPFSMAPWAQEKIDPTLPPILKVLRGDFFCLPFGGNATKFRGERHPPHGETANAAWNFESLDETDDGGARLHLSMRTRIRRGRVDKFITLPPDHDAVYQRHVISNMRGPMTPGHHAMLKFPDEAGAGVISTSPFESGQVFVEPLESPENRGYSMLKPAAEFESLRAVPTITGQAADVSRYPARRGFEDLVMITSELDVPFAWTAVTFPRQGFAWFALKDPRILRSTIFWMSNGGRHYAPWNGRHINVMGLEEVTANFHLGLAESARKNELNQRGIPTTITLDPRRPLTINYIMAIAAIPRGFDRVAKIVRGVRGGVVLQSDSGKDVRVPVDVDFLHAK